MCEKERVCLRQIRARDTVEGLDRTAPLEQACISLRFRPDRRQGPAWARPPPQMEQFTPHEHDAANSLDSIPNFSLLQDLVAFQLT